MNDKVTGMPQGDERKPQWRTPVLTSDSIADSTRNRFSLGIDFYERSNPVEYGS